MNHNSMFIFWLLLVIATFPVLHSVLTHSPQLIGS